ncbi:MAG: ATP-binding cassette domain-containing protein [Clostridia bacterium]|nr:ATP-binding cassette domain-containing protein [Clostridia bacterium]
MNAVEIKGLTKNFGPKQAVSGLNMTVPAGAIYGFIGENGSGKSTTEKMICGLILPSGGSIKLYGKDYTDADVRARVGVLIEAPGCFPNMSVWNNMMLQASNLGIKNSETEVQKVLKMVRMEGAAGNKYKNCSLGMKQRIGIAMALLGDPVLLVLDEPLNGLDADGMRIMREVLTDITKDGKHTVIVSSHLLGELQKIATHYGIIRHGKMLCEMTAEELDANCRTYVALQTKDMNRTKALLACKYSRVEEDEAGYLRVYDAKSPEEIVTYLYENGMLINEIKTDKIGLEEYYIDLMNGGSSSAPAKQSHFPSKSKEER